MATVKQYIESLRARQDRMGSKFGVELRRSGVEIRVLNLTLLALIAVVLKTLVDKGVLTDADLSVVLNSAADDGWDREPIEPPTP